MTFSVTYMGSDGARLTEIVEASGRGDCFAKCRARGITPISVTEAKGSGRAGARSSRAEARSPGGNAGRRGGQGSHAVYVFLIAGIVLAAGVIWWSLRDAGGGTEGAPKKKPTSLVKEVTPAPAAKAPAVDVAPAEPPAVTNKGATVTPPKKKMTLEEREAMIEKKIRETPIDLSTRTNRAFRTGLEQTLAAIFTTQLGAPPPPLPLRLTPVAYIHLESILNAPNEILDTDSEKVVEAKMACAAAKKMLKEHIDKGGDPEKFLESYYSHLKQAHEEWKVAQRTLLETMKSDPGLAVTMEAEVNENFKARGMRPIKMPPKLKERYGIE